MDNKVFNGLEVIYDNRQYNCHETTLFEDQSHVIKVRHKHFLGHCVRLSFSTSFDDDDIFISSRDFKLWKKSDRYTGRKNRIVTAIAY